MKKILLFNMASLLFFAMPAFSQETTKPVMSKSMTPAEVNLRVPSAGEAYSFDRQRQVPDDLIVPGEWEESQAILLAWPYPSSNTSTYNVLWSKLINTIQKECEVWIMVDQASDTTLAISRMLAQGVSLTNHKFLIKPTNAFWARDYGPWGFYHGQSDSLGFVDIQYYNTRPLDNQVPSWLAGHLDLGLYSSRIKMEGGNFMVDGYGHGFYSTRLNINNANSNWQNPSWALSQTFDTVQKIFNLNTVTELTSLNCDGGTGHIDIYTKLLDEQTILVSEYPSEVTASDKQIIENNTALMKTLTSTYGRPFKIHRIPMATRNNGTYPITCTQIDSDARGFVNGLFVNKTFIFPSYSNTVSGNVAGDSAAIDMYRKFLPGYNIVLIDARVLTTMGGAIHCITMQIPSENPIRFWHPTVEGIQPWATGGFHILSKITNKDGIASSECKWRKKGSSTWNAIQLTDSSGYLTCIIPGLNILSNDTIEYFLHAESNNGKQMSKPITAPNGYYTFYFDDITNAASVFEPYSKDHLFAAYPNPAREQVNVQFYLKAPASVRITLTDALGRQLHQTELPGQDSGKIETQINISGLQQGIYYYSLYTNGALVKTRKLIVQ
ncbi:MAG: agmatine deiminase family protein [Bacteroidetes bacterium]|nr:agmatine deiminase family protein [Bacteroidota bacterium]